MFTYLQIYNRSSAYSKGKKIQHLKDNLVFELFTIRRLTYICNVLRKNYLFWKEKNIKTKSWNQIMQCGKKKQNPKTKNNNKRYKRVSSNWLNNKTNSKKAPRHIRDNPKLRSLLSPISPLSGWLPPLESPSKTHLFSSQPNCFMDNIIIFYLGVHRSCHLNPPFLNSTYLFYGQHNHLPPRGKILWYHLNPNKVFGMIGSEVEDTTWVSWYSAREPCLGYAKGSRRHRRTKERPSSLGNAKITQPTFS